MYIEFAQCGAGIEGTAKMTMEGTCGGFEADSQTSYG